MDHMRISGIEPSNITIDYEMKLQIYFIINF